MRKADDAPRILQRWPCTAAAEERCAAPFFFALGADETISLLNFLAGVLATGS